MAALYVLWSPQSGPICAYDDHALAYAHASTMLGVEITRIDIRTALPDVVRDDMAAEYDKNEPTPVTTVYIDDIDEA